MLMESRPKNFSDLLQVSGLSHGTDVWVGNAQELIASGKCTISQVIGTRDSIMTHLTHKGVEPKMAFQITEIVRKGKAAALLTAQHRKAMVDAGIETWYIDSCMKIKYMYPKAHAAAYVISAVRMAWYKVYHPLAYYAAYLTVRGADLDANAVLGGHESVVKRLRSLRALGKDATKKEQDRIPVLMLVNEMLLRGVAVLPVSIYKSHARVYLLEGGKVRLPFAALEGVGEKAAESLQNAREDGEGAYLSRDDFKRRTGASSAVMALLEGMGAFAGLPKSRQLSLFGF
jgi:DNA polymerase-3 subunit alpha (Gram-positive type)